MKNKKIAFLIFTFALILISSFSFILGEEAIVTSEDEGFELEKLISLINCLLALVLFTITFISYRKSGKSKLLYVSLAFILFSIRSFLVGYELFGSEIPYVDPISVTLDFVTMLSFFYGVLKK